MSYPPVIVVDDSDGRAPLISSVRVEQIFLDCLFRPEEVEGLEEGQAPEGAVIIDGSISPYGLHAGRLESHRAEVTEMLMNLPLGFRRSSGGGWSFLQACDDRNGVQWTGFHMIMSQLFVLGMGLGLVKYLMPRELWSALPGGMPYLVILDGPTPGGKALQYPMGERIEVKRS